jgi:GT2 family glycosyltransferase
MDKKVTVIIPYNTDRGWLKDAIASVPKDIQLLVSQGEGNWPANFNKVLSQAAGDYIKFLHEDDMLTLNCIEDSINTFCRVQKADFIHGNAMELYQDSGILRNWVPSLRHPTLEELKTKNYLHSVTLMYRREIFEKIGGFNETLNNQEEYEFNLRCLKAGFKLGYCNSPLGIYRRHPAQKVRTITKEEIRKEKQMVLSWYE